MYAPLLRAQVRHARSPYARKSGYEDAALEMCTAAWSGEVQILQSTWPVAGI
jgi:hypothetical protein